MYRKSKWTPAFGGMTVAAVMVLASSAAAQSYPTKPIRFIVPFGPGGPGDTIGRMVGRKLSESLGQPVVVDNRSGATTIVGTSIASNAA